MADYSEQQLIGALRKADAAGDDAAARAIAKRIQSMRQGPQAAPAQTAPQPQAAPTQQDQPGATDTGIGNLIANKPQPSAIDRFKSTRQGSVGTRLLEMGQAAAHHAMSPLHGMAQFVEHGANAAANLLPADSGIRQAVNRTVAADDAALQRRESGYQASVPTNAGTITGAAVGEIAPFLLSAPARILGYAGEKAAGLLPKAPQLLRRMMSGGAQGAALGVLQPVTGDGGYAGQKAAQVAVGGGAGGSIPVVASSLRGLAGLAKPVISPDKVASGQLARLLQAGQGDVEKLRNAPRYFEGEQPTTAQILQTPRAVQAEKALANRPDMKTAFMEQANANNTGRVNVLHRLAGSDEDLAGAVKARRDTSKGYRSASLAEDGSPKVDAKPLTATLKTLANSANATVRAAAKEHLGVLKANGGDEVPAFVLDDIRQNAGGMLAKYAPNGAVGTPEAAKYGPVSTQIIRTLDKSVPGYRDYLAAYRADSAPINTMESARRILSPVDQRGLDSSGAGRLSLAQLNSGLNKLDKSRYGMTPEARGEVEGLRQSLRRESVSNSVTSPGSDTAYNLASDGWLAKQIYGPTMQGPTVKGYGVAGGVGALLGHSVAPGLLGQAGGAALAAGLKKGADAVNTRIAERVSQGMRDPQEAARMIEAYLKQNPNDAPALLRAYPQWSALLGYETAGATRPR